LIVLRREPCNRAVILFESTKKNPRNSSGGYAPAKTPRRSDTWKIQPGKKMVKGREIGGSVGCKDGGEGGDVRKFELKRTSGDEKNRWQPAGNFQLNGKMQKSRGGIWSL